MFSNNTYRMYFLHSKFLIGCYKSGHEFWTGNYQLSSQIKSSLFSAIGRSIHIGNVARSNDPKVEYQSKTRSFDYVIVGAGSAGCVLANRLLDNGSKTVNLLEAGSNDNSWKIHMPVALFKNLAVEKHNWNYKTKPQVHLNNREIEWPRGRVLGGSSSLNAMVYVRGHPYDYDRWQEEGAKGWSYANCLPYFKKAQSHEHGENLYRGGKGPLQVARSKYDNILHTAWVKAGNQAGYGYTDDVNGYKQEGFGYNDYTIHKGERWSTSKAYLRPVLSNKNLTVTTDALVTKVLFDGKKAIGVEFINKNGEINKVMANREVILSGGAINSPQILMLSGVGDADELGKHSINVVEHIPGVGRNLQDHTHIFVGYKCKKPVSFYSEQLLHNEIGTFLQWSLFKKGLGTSSVLNAVGFIRSEASVKHPDIEYLFFPILSKDFGKSFIKVHGFQVYILTLRSLSTGSITLNSKDPRQHPIIDPNYNSLERDFWEYRQSIKWTREIFSQAAFDEFRGEEVFPGIDVNSDSKMNDFIREREGTTFHPSCTCKMGSPDKNDTVTDPECRVVGLDNLRVVDASVMPSIMSGNTNAPTIMIAEKVADMILGRAPLPKINNVPIWKPENQSKQRDY